MSQITWPDIISGLIALGAFGFSVYNFWYTKIRKGKLTYICNKWTVIISSKRDKNGSFNLKSAFFLLNVSIRNNGPKSITVRDIILKVTDTQKKIFYFKPHTLFDFDYFSSNLGKGNPLKTQKGLVPLPIEIPGNITHRFKNSILFIPQSFEIEDILEVKEFPINVDVLVKDEHHDYAKVAHQKIYKENVKGIKHGSFSGIESSTTKKVRKDFIEKDSQNA